MAIAPVEDPPASLYQNSFLIGQLGRDNIEVQFPHELVNRLSATCFRNCRPLAGNLLYKSLRELLADPEVLTRFEKRCLEFLGEKIGSGGLLKPADVGFTIQHPKRHVGWEFTVPLHAVPPDLIEEFALNKRARSLRVKLAATHVFAPLTDLITFTCDFRHQADKGKYAVRLWDVHPGVDVGKWRGNVTKREGRVFLDFNHPGERY